MVYWESAGPAYGIKSRNMILSNRNRFLTYIRLDSNTTSSASSFVYSHILFLLAHYGAYVMPCRATGMQMLNVVLISLSTPILPAPTTSIDGDPAPESQSLKMLKFPTYV